MRKSLFILLVVLFGASLFVWGFFSDNNGGAFPSITARELHEKINLHADLVLLDVRTRAEWKGSRGHINGAILIPLQELNTRFPELNEMKNKEIIVYCRTGNRSRVATALLREKGFNAVNMLGGMQAWNQIVQPDTVHAGPEEPQ